MDLNIQQEQQQNPLPNKNIHSHTPAFHNDKSNAKPTKLPQRGATRALLTNRWKISSWLSWQLCSLSPSLAALSWTTSFVCSRARKSPSCCSFCSIRMRTLQVAQWLELCLKSSSPCPSSVHQQFLYQACLSNKVAACQVNTEECLMKHHPDEINPLFFFFFFLKDAFCELFPFKFPCTWTLD